jgi:hypothetical protein
MKILSTTKKTEIAHRASILLCCVSFSRTVLEKREAKDRMIKITGTERTIIIAKKDKIVGLPSSSVGRSSDSTTIRSAIANMG